MVIVKIWGGIGNQLFQLVFGEYIKNRFNQEVVYDINSYVSVDGLRVNELDALDLNIIYNNTTQFSKYRGVKNRLLRFAWQLNLKHHYIDEGCEIPSSFLSDHLYFFQGYWQTIEYYKWLVNNVPDFRIKQRKIPDELKNLFQSIQSNPPTASIHIRRGDYFKPENIDVFGVCDSDYYNRALKLLKEIKAYSKLYVFSDDLEWVKNNVEIPSGAVFIPNYDISQFAYIELMSKCRHHIISNSSFSWWGAVLNSKENAIVIAPSLWMRNTKKTIALDSWKKIEI